MSRASSSAVKSLYKELDMFIEKRTVIATEPITIEFEPFPWGGRKENEGIVACYGHVHQQFKGFEFPLGPDKFNFVDVHLDNTALDYDMNGNLTVGKLVGGTDFVILPAGSPPDITMQWCVLFQVKSEDAVRKQKTGLHAFLPQAQLEALASRFLSYQPRTMVVLTDFCTGALTLSIVYSEENTNFGVMTHEVTLSQMAIQVKMFLEQYSKPDAGYNPFAFEDDSMTMDVREFKRLKRGHEGSLALQHFHDMEDSAKPGTKERAQLVYDLFSELGFRREEMPFTVKCAMYA